jgi:tetratricopeptide (TPR) repeat protein
MFEEHPTVEELDRFLRKATQAGGATRKGQVVRHLLGNCAYCREHLNTMGWSRERLENLLELPTTDSWNLAEEWPAVGAYDYGKAFAQAEYGLSAFLAASAPIEIDLDSVLAEVNALPPDEQVRLVSTEKRFACTQLVHGLIDQSHAARYADPEKMLHLALLARLVADRCTTESADNELRLADLRTKAWGHFGNSLRVNGHLPEAEEALATAQRWREQGTGDPPLHARLLEQLASLRTFQGQFDQALLLNEDASCIYRELGETHLLAIAMMGKANALVYAGDPESAVRVLNRAIPLIDHEEDPHLLLAVCHNLVRCYIDLDSPEQALALYTEVRPLYREFDENTILLRAGWQEGQLLRDLGHLRAAEEALLRARTGFMDRDLAYEVALVSLDLAAVYVKLRLVPELKETVATTVPIFRALRVSREALGSLLQLQQVADQEHQALELIRLLNVSIGPLSKKSFSKDS